MPVLLALPVRSTSTFGCRGAEDFGAPERFVGNDRIVRVLYRLGGTNHVFNVITLQNSHPGIRRLAEITPAVPGQIRSASLYDKSRPKTLDESTNQDQDKLADNRK